METNKMMLHIVIEPTKLGINWDKTNQHCDFTDKNADLT